MRESKLPGGGGQNPLVRFDSSSRAKLSALEDFDSAPMPAVTRRKSKAAATKRKKGSKKVRIVSGRVKLRVTGYPGVQTLVPSHLVKHIAVTKLRAAAKKVLKDQGKAPSRAGKKRKGAKKGKKRSAKRKN